MPNAVKRLLKKLPGIRQLVASRDHLLAEFEKLRKSQGFYEPPGHFYSPIPCLEEMTRDQSRIFDQVPRNLPGIDLNEAAQLELLKAFVAFYREMPFQAEKQRRLRYYYDNPAYSYSDAILLHCMIRHLRPRRIIEVGSGFSSCMMLDTNELFFDGSIETTFIDPCPELLLSLVKEDDKQRIKLIPSRLQDVDFREFDALRANDILFVDSTHVSKTDSDVNHIVFDILPRLASGVHVHFHDVAYPFEYPREWVLEGRAWNESYLLRAFLLYNNAFRTVLMNTYMQRYHEPFFRQHLPLCLRNPGGSFWMRKE